MEPRLHARGENPQFPGTDAPAQSVEARAVDTGARRSYRDTILSTEKGYGEKRAPNLP
jgi:hypothetical protein